jgi:SH3-like domain-containing protein
MMRVFLCHANQDKSAAESIAFSLRARGHEVFLDRDDLPPGGSFDQRIERAVKRSDVFVFLISPDSVAEGRYTLTELTFARHKWPDPNEHVLPVMARKTPLEQVPAYLKAVTILEPSGSISAETSAAVDAMQVESSWLAKLPDVMKKMMSPRIASGLLLVVFFGACVALIAELFGERIIGERIKCLVSPNSPSCNFTAPPPGPGPTGPICLKADERPPTYSCGSDGDYVVTNVRGDDPDHGLNVRSDPDVAGSVWGVLAPNTTELTVGTCRNGWCEVQCKGLKGWSRDRYLSLRADVLYSVTGLDKARLGLPVRNGPDQTCSAVAFLSYDARDVVIHACQTPRLGSKWCLITHERRSGWVPLESLSRQNAN